MRALIGSIVTMALLGTACAAASHEGRWDEKAVRGLRVSVDEQVSAGSPDLQAKATELRSTFIQAMSDDGMQPLAGQQRGDGIVRLALARPTGDTWRARVELDGPTGAKVAEVDVVRHGALPQTAEEMTTIARRLVTKLERSFPAQEYALEGDTWGGQ